MQIYSAFKYILSQVGSLVLDMDKSSFEDRIKEVKRLGYEGCAKIAKELKGTGQALAYQAMQMWSDVNNKSCTNLFIYLDCCSSGATILECLTRDEIGMMSCGVFNTTKPGNLYQEITELLNKKLNLKLTRSEVKAFTVPFYYGGDKNVRDALGDENVHMFHETYRELLPGAYDFRNKSVDSWDETKEEYHWTMPDAYQVYVPVLSDTEKVTVDVKEASYKCHFKVQAPRPISISYLKDGYWMSYRNNKTKGLGAHMIHSTDALILRELVGMAHMSMQRANKTLANVNIGEFDSNNNTIIERLYKAWVKTNYPSVRWLYEMEGSENAYSIPQELYDQLKELTDTLIDKEFDVITIHDEFGCLPSYVNSMRWYVNRIYANLYRSTLMDYFNERFHMDVEIRQYSDEVYNRILNADYLLS